MRSENAGRLWGKSLRYECEVKLMLESARDAGKLLMRTFRQPCKVEEKGVLDLVTEADLASERLISDRIRSQFAHDAITAEEGGLSGDSSRRWYIDPVDGTVNYAHGNPSFAVVIGFVDEGGLAAGAVYNPFREECFTAARGEGARWNGLPIQRTVRDRLSESVLFINSHGLRSGHADPILEILRRLGQRVLSIHNNGCMSLALCGVATGLYDAAVTLDVDAYATPASALIMQECGVKVTDRSGSPYLPGAQSLVASGPALHAEILAALR